MMFDFNVFRKQGIPHKDLVTRSVSQWRNLFQQNLFLTVLLALSFQTVGAPEDELFAPDNGILFTVGQDVDSVNNYVADVGIQPGGVVNYVGIAQLDGLFADADAGAGRNNVAELAATYPNSALVVGVSMNNQLDAVVAGNFNANIDTLLNTLAGYDRPIYLRWAYEIDGVQWNISHTPQRIKTSFSYVRDRIEQLGYSDKIALVWQVSSYCYNQYEDLNNWYPGNDVVDWIGLSYFTPQDCTNQSRVTQAADFARANGKPLFINESTPQRYDLEALTYTTDGAAGTNRISKSGADIWNEWFQGYFNFILQDYADVVKAVTYINADWDSPEQYRWGGYSNGAFTGYTEGYWGDSRVQADATILSNWLTQMNDARFLQLSEDLFSQLDFGQSNPPDDPSDPPVDPPTDPVDPPPATDVDLGIAWVDDDSFMVFHKDLGWTANWHYLCVDDQCYSGERADGLFQRQVDGAVPGQSYRILFKVQDDTLNQFISEELTVLFSQDAQVPNDPIDPPTDPVDPPTDPVDPPADPVTPTDDFGISYVSDTSFLIFHQDQNWTADWHYLCVDGYCISGERSDGLFSRLVSNAVLGQSYDLEFKVQDAQLSQYIVTLNDVVFEKPSQTTAELDASVSINGAEIALQANVINAGTTDYSLAIYVTVPDSSESLLADNLTVPHSQSYTANEAGTYQFRFEAAANGVETLSQQITQTYNPDNPPPPPSSALVTLHNAGEFGSRLLVAEGKTAAGFSLYTFDIDEVNISNCNGDCAVTWPPLLLSDDDNLNGVSGLGVITRNDGTTQVTYLNQPLYLYANDVNPGDTNGQGLGNVWWLASVDIPQFIDTTWLRAAPLACDTAFSAQNIPTWGYHVFQSGNILEVRAGQLFNQAVWSGQGRFVFFRNDASGSLQHLGTLEGARNANALSVTPPTDWLNGETVVYFSYERVVTPLANEIGDALAYHDSGLFALNKTCNNNSYDTTAEDFAGWLRFQHPQGFFNDHNVFNERIDPVNNSAGHFQNVPRFKITLLQDQPDEDLLFQIDLVYENYSTLSATNDITWSGIEGSEERAGGGSPRHSLSQQCVPSDGTGNSAVCNLGNQFSYGQNIDWELRVIPRDSAEFNLYTQMLYYVKGVGWAKESADPRALLGGNASNDAFGANEFERAAAFMQHKHTDDLQLVRDFVEQHDEFRVPIGTDLNPGFHTCESCHINDGRSQVTFEVPGKGTRIAPPLIGLGLLQDVALDNKVGFGWQGDNSTVEDSVRFALDADFGVTEPDAVMLQRLTDYAENVSVPQRNKSLLFDTEVLAGEALFEGQLQCASCHTPTQQLVNGDIIRPYSDLQTHDLGKGAIRTAPLWGVGRTADVVAFSMDMLVNGQKNAAHAIAQRQSVPANEASVLFMHDGSAQGLEAAILAHNGEALQSKSAWNNTSASEKQALLSFLRSL